MAERLREARRKAGHESAARAAEAFGWGSSTLTSHENGTREYDVETAIKYARAFKVQPGWLLALDHVQAPGRITTMEQTRTVPHLGKVAAGVWRDSSSYDQADDPTSMTIDSMPGDAAEELFAVTVEGPSMNRTIPDNATLVCRRVAYSFMEASPGDLVIVERRNHDLLERTCKRLAIEDGHFMLLCESDRPEFQEPIPIGKPDRDIHIDNEIVIVGVVLRAVVDLRMRN